MTTSSLRASERRAQPAPLLRVAVEVHPRSGGGRSLCVMTLTGDLDLMTAPQLHSATDLALPAAGTAAASASPAPDVVVDLAAVEFVDSAGLGALLSTLRRTTALGGRLAVVGAREQASRLLTMTGVDRVVSLHATLAEAVSARTATA